MKVLVEGAIAQILRHRPAELFRGRGPHSPETVGEQVEVRRAPRSVVPESENYVKLNKKVARGPSCLEHRDYSKLAGYLASPVHSEKQEIRADRVSERLEKVLGMMESGSPSCRWRSASGSEFGADGEDGRRLFERAVKAIQKELGDGESRDEMRGEELHRQEFSRKRARPRRAGSPDEPDAEAMVVRNYLDWLLGLPWKKRSSPQRLGFAEKC